MSNYTQLARHPETGVEEMAEWIDDYFGKHIYGVRFSDGKVFHPADDKHYPINEMVKINQEAGLYDIVMDAKDCPPAITCTQPDEYEQQIIKWCDDLKCKLIDKYRKGKEEHGDLANGKPLDCAKEISAEVADILIYHCIDVVQKGKE